MHEFIGAIFQCKYLLSCCHNYLLCVGVYAVIPYQGSKIGVSGI